MSSTPSFLVQTCRDPQFFVFFCKQTSHVNLSMCLWVAEAFALKTKCTEM